MSKRVPSGPSPRTTGKTKQIAVRVPLALYGDLEKRGNITKQVLYALNRPPPNTDERDARLAAIEALEAAPLPMRDTNAVAKGEKMIARALAALRGVGD